jgi:hypothetical protein
MSAWQGAEKWRRERLWKSRGAEKSKNYFPTPLGNPANPAGFHFHHSLGDCERLTKKPNISFTKKRDISIVG